MKPSGSLLLLVSTAYLLLCAEAVSQAGFQAYKVSSTPTLPEQTILSVCAHARHKDNYHTFCRTYEKIATDGKPCPKSQKPVCGTDGQTYNNRCEFCKTAMERNGKLGFKHDGKC